MSAGEGQALGLDGVNWVRLTFVDVLGGVHAVQLPAARFDQAVASGTAFDGSAIEGRGRQLEEDMLLQPDPDTLLDLGGGLARAACSVLTRDGAPWPGDPRTVLRSIVDRVGELGDAYRVSAELELYLLDGDDKPVDRAGYFDDRESAGMSVVRRAADALCGFGVDVIACHHEAGPGQFEVDLAPMGALAAADALVLAKQVTRHEAARQGLRATFMARPFAGEPGSGLHLHQQVGEALVHADGRLTETGQCVVAGQLAHARGLSALAAPTVNSYKRLHSGAEAPSAAVWAHVNRAALIRVSPLAGLGATVEYRGADPSANPYLLLAGLLLAADHGLEAELELGSPLEEEVGSFDPAGLDSLRADPLPRDLDDALDALLADDVLVDGFDPAVLSRLVDGRRAEADEYRAQVTSWERARYLDE